MSRRDVRTIDVEGLPEPVAQAINAVVQTLREQLTDVRAEVEARPKVNLPVWRGKIIGDLTRNKIYKDVG